MLSNYLSEEKEDKEWMKKVSSNYKATKYHEKIAENERPVTI